MNCRHARRLIAEHLADGETELPPELRAHVADCARCGATWWEQVKVHSVLTDAGRAPAPAPAADLAQRARRRLMEGERVPPAPLRVVLAYGSLAAVVIIGAIAILAARSLSPTGDGTNVARVGKSRPAEQSGSRLREDASVLRRSGQPVPHDKAPSPGGTGSSLPVRARPSADARVDPVRGPASDRDPVRDAASDRHELPVAPETDEIDLLIIVWAPLAIATDEERAPEGQQRLHTDLLAPRSADVVAQATMVASLARGPDLSADPSVPPIQSLMFAAMPVVSMDSVAALTSVQADFELPDTESLPDPAASDATTAPEPMMLVDNATSGGEDDEQPCEPQIALCVDDGDDPVLLCGELGVGGGDAV